MIRPPDTVPGVLNSDRRAYEYQVVLAIFMRNPMFSSSSQKNINFTGYFIGR